MTANFQFDQSTIYAGFTVTVRISDKMSKTIILAEAFKRLESVFESLNLHALQENLKDQSFFIRDSVEKLKDGDIVMISSVEVNATTGST
tara:strand:- start:232 stop:501 length:270 start_codon:yes stop_codon:yes gene_type:complete